MACLCCVDLVAVWFVIGMVHTLSLLVASHAVKIHVFQAKLDVPSVSKLQWYFVPFGALLCCLRQLERIISDRKSASRSRVECFFARAVS